MYFAVDIKPKAIAFCLLKLRRFATMITIIESRIVSLLFSVLLLFAFSPCANAEREFTEVSIIQLISVPERFIGEKIETSGYLLLVDEADPMIFYSSESLQNAEVRSGLVVDPILHDPEVFGQDLSEANTKYVVVEGTFERNSKYFGDHAVGYGIYNLHSIRPIR